MRGLMQDWPLTVDRIIDYAARWHGDVEVVSRSPEGSLVRTCYATLRDRARRLSAALWQRGVRQGDRVATLAWNSGHHLEAWYGVMGMGAVCHTLNPRMSADQLRHIIEHAGSRAILLDGSLAPVLRAVGPLPACVATVIMFGPHGEVGIEDALSYEALLAGDAPAVPWGAFDEGLAAGLCYTSGTTGLPKGVLYSHRSHVLHTLVTRGADMLAVRARDVVMPIVPMFHANAWGLAFSAPAAGAKLVMPGAKLDGASLHELIEHEGVTFAAAVPTVWQTLLTHLHATGGQLDRLERVLIGGTAVSEAMARKLQDDYGVQVVHAWGMTEVSPVGALAAPTQGFARMPAETQGAALLKQGRVPFGLDMKIVNGVGEELPRDGAAAGTLMIRGGHVARAYYRGEAAILDANGFFDTGDVATIDPQGFMQLVDRAKDLIKSGGEWISSIEIENIVAGHPDVASCAVIAAGHLIWGERPLLILRPQPTAEIGSEAILDMLRGKISRWWMPDAVLFVDELPLGATGKVDKKILRMRFADYFTAAAGDRSQHPQTRE